MTNRTIEVNLEYPRFNASRAAWPRSRPVVAEALKELVERRWGGAVRHTTWVLHPAGNLEFRFELRLPGEGMFTDDTLRAVLTAWWEETLGGSAGACLAAPEIEIFPPNCETAAPLFPVSPHIAA